MHRKMNRVEFDPKKKSAMERKKKGSGSVYTNEGRHVTKGAAAKPLRYESANASVSGLKCALEMALLMVKAEDSGKNPPERFLKEKRELAAYMLDAVKSLTTEMLMVPDPAKSAKWKNHG